ncbi:FAD/NAD(P)-binding domain-containing protein [Mytilinidion resinicola]|uniref:FAD/NAD(P)-binding domain-containing protein n=1 Tax=Mytilinidion resinicola TaxID=574789 RepID=A0A6A6Z301_9PEZI|nr:FAD/NAD(P)-binding domain-containing protein [Mytilinidion resinicola]KAF2815109.1 FAD/NAD(P)-binding domain-containing protein [Mytilinidion resinicola]
MATPTPKLTVAIMGAGPAGLTLASLLRAQSIPYTIFDLSSTVSTAGGTLDLHPSAGQAALRAANLWTPFVKHARPESDVMKIVSPAGVVLWDENKGGADEQPAPETEDELFGGRPEIDRSALLSILLEGAGGADAVTWNKKLVEVVPGANSTHTLRFADGTVSEEFDLVVGTDGAWSKVRNILTPTKPHYSGISSLELWSLDVANRNPWLSAYAGAGNCFTFDADSAIQAQRNGDGSVRTYASLRVPETFFADYGVDFNAPDAAKHVPAYVEKYFGHVGDDLKKILLSSTDKVIPRTLYHLPPGFSWEGKPGVTLLGDSAHLMTPFAGVGVNAAMLDALELSKAIVAVAQEPEKGSLAEAIRGYEKELFPRGEKYARKTLANLNGHFKAGGSEELTARMRAHHAPH